MWVRQVVGIASARAGDLRSARLSDRRPTRRRDAEPDRPHDDDARPRPVDRRARLLVLDEPTAALTDVERDKLFGAIRNATSLGVGVLYVSHRLAEVFEISDSYTVLRNGAVAAGGAIGDTSPREVVTAMTGRSIDSFFPVLRPVRGAVLLQVRNITGRRIRQFSTEVRSGEIVGIAGLGGSGRSELLRIVSGVQPPHSGTIVVDGQERRLGRPWRGQRRGLVYVPQERRVDGLFPDTAERNLNATTIGRHAAIGPLMSTAAERQHALGLWSRFGVRGSGPGQQVLTLSGGNQQKVMLAKFMALEPRIVLLDDPTHGVDVATKVEIYNTIADLAGAGAAVVVVSSELLELVGLCHRIVVVHEGQQVAEFDHSEFDEGRILSACFGQEGSDGHG